MKYRKKPVVVEALQWTGDNLVEIADFIKDTERYFEIDSPNKEIKIGTLEGIMTANVNDYIIKGIKGELYPCKPDIFEKIYDIVKEMDNLGFIDISCKEINI